MKPIDKQIWLLRYKMAQQVACLILYTISIFAAIPMLNAMSNSDWPQAIFWLLVVFSPDIMNIKDKAK